MVKKLLLNFHRWLGFLTGPLVFIIALTGAIYVFQEEIQDISCHYRFYKHQQHQSEYPPSFLLSKAQQLHPKKIIHAILYDEPGRSTRVIFYAYKQYHRVVYLNPQTATILADIDQETGFFPWILEGHFYLWLPEWLGQPIVAWSTLIFALVLISGLITWLSRGNRTPKKWRFKKTQNWKRRNYDLHSLIGFYSISFGLLFATTGLVWGFVWFQEAYYKVTSGGKTFIPYTEPKITRALHPDSTSMILDAIFANNKRGMDQWLEIHPPETPRSCIAYNLNPDRDTYYRMDYHYFDPILKNEKRVEHIWGKYQDLSIADKLQRANYDIHVGSILGLLGKIIAFITSLLIASLPVTGLIIYINRKMPKLVMKNIYD